MQYSGKRQSYKYAAAAVVAILFVSAVAGTAFYYQEMVNGDNSKIASLNTKVASLNADVANLTNQTSTLESQMPANLVANLTVTRGVSSTAGGVCGFFTLDLNGTVTNTGMGTAHDAGLHVVAYGELPVYNDSLLSAEGVSINITVPLASGEFMGFGSEYVGNGTSVPISYALTDLNGEQSAQISIEICGACVDSNWTVTPVWTNST